MSLGISATPGTARQHSRSRICTWALWCSREVLCKLLNHVRVGRGSDGGDKRGATPIVLWLVVVAAESSTSEAARLYKRGNPGAYVA